MICKQCLKEKDISEFYKHPQMPSGYLNFCKDCKRLYARINRSKEYDRKRYWSSNKKRLNVIFHCLMARCYNIENSHYKRYGKKGITVERKTSKEFYNDMVESYDEHWIKNGKQNKRQTQIDRIDNNGNYCKENCRRVTAKENSRNRSFYS